MTRKLPWKNQPRKERPEATSRGGVSSNKTQSEARDAAKKRRGKIAFVCQRYGLEVNGGSELYCRQVAEKLAAVYDVTVYTTCALDYTTWANKYSPGEEAINGVRVLRYRVRAERNQAQFGKLCEKVAGDPNHSDALEAEWIEKQGPLCPELIEALQREHGQYRAVLFMTYLYYTSAVGLPLGFDNAILIPTVHDEPWVYLRHYDKVFNSARAFAWNTPEERAFAQKRFPGIVGKPEVMTGIGVDAPEGPLPELPAQIKGEKYIVYAGRIDENKGCKEMFEFFRRYKRENGGDLKLVLMGKEVLKVPRDPDIVNLGFVSEEMKFAVMAQSVALVLFSRFESLSMVVLESMLMGRPVLVTEHCEVLKGHCLRSNAGLYFADYPEFKATLNYLLTHEAQYEGMRENGRQYVEENYRWNVIVDRYAGLIEGISEK